MKKILSYIAGMVCIALLFSGCSLVILNNPDITATGSKEPDPSQQVSTQPTQTDPLPTEGSTLPLVNDPYPQYVQTDINESIEIDNRLCTLISIPKLLPFSEDAIACQKEIDEFFVPYVQDIRDYSAQGNSPITVSIHHMVYLNGNILSLVIQEEFAIDDSNFWVYNFDVESGKRLSTLDLIGKLGISDYTGRLTKLAKERFEEANPKSDVEIYNEQMENTVSAKNISDAMPYVGYNGQLMVVIEIFSTVGGPRYTHTIPFT